MQRFSRRAQGFTLIELAIVLVIVAILATIAIPQYRRYVIRAHRTDAQQALFDLAARQERYIYSHNAYAANLADLNGASDMAGALYEISLARPSETTYTLTATAAGTQAAGDPQCQTLTLTNFGAQGSTGTVANDPACWGKR